VKPSSRQRVRIYSLILLAGALAVSWHLWRNRTLRQVDPASLEQTMGRWVRLQGFVDEFRRVIVEDAAGRKYLLRLPAPAQAPAGNLVSVTGRLAHLAPGAGDSFGTAELWDVTIVDLGKQPPPPPPPAHSGSPPDLHVEVIAKRYEWSFRYPNGRVSGELHLPTGRSVRLNVTSTDVIHSMRLERPGSRDHMAGASAVPGSVQSVDVLVRESGRSLIVCAEYCGPRHSQCGAPVVAEPAPELELWLSRMNADTLATPASQPVAPAAQERGR
jgi:heme/copper-type cytochrome/quinol oxidase subunit 2